MRVAARNGDGTVAAALSANNCSRDASVAQLCDVPQVSSPLPSTHCAVAAPNIGSAGRVHAAETPRSPPPTAAPSSDGDLRRRRALHALYAFGNPAADEMMHVYKKKKKIKRGRIRNIRNAAHVKMPRDPETEKRMRAGTCT